MFTSLPVVPQWWNVKKYHRGTSKFSGFRISLLFFAILPDKYLTAMSSAWPENKAQLFLRTWSCHILSIFFYLESTAQKTASCFILYNIISWHILTDIQTNVSWSQLIRLYVFWDSGALSVWSKRVFWWDLWWVEDLIKIYLRWSIKSQPFFCTAVGLLPFFPCIIVHPCL